MILGIHSGHDPGAALVHEGNIIAAVNEERMTGNKLAFGFPEKSIHEVMRIAGITADEVDCIALQRLCGSNPLEPNSLFWRQKALLTKGRSLLDFTYVAKGELHELYGWKSIVPNLLMMTGIPRWVLTELAALIGIKRIFGLRKKIVPVDHHTAHWASAYFTSGFDRALSVVVEGYDGEAGMRIGLVENGCMTQVAVSRSPHSPGLFYALCTRMMGFNFLLHGGKITGLAAYGDPDKAMGVVAGLLRSEGMELRISPRLFELELEWARTREMPRCFKAFSREDVAAAFQARLEKVIVETVTAAMHETGCRNILLCGGVAANVKLNQRIMSIPGVEQIFIHPGMSDCGLALGAALYLDKKRHPSPNPPLGNVFWGTPIDNRAVEAALKKHGLAYSRKSNMPKTIARLLQDGKIVVRVTGRMEYGPRALGNRSILSHCQDPGINTRLNECLNRTEFMPFAPAVLAEEAHKCFKGYKAARHAAEFMTTTFDCTGWMVERCPAVVHVDHTARPQFVTPASNPDFYAIIKEYQAATGIPALINTSFNMHNEPVPATADNALRVFMQSALDYLAIGDYLVSKTKEEEELAGA